MKQGSCLLDCFKKVTILLKPVKNHCSNPTAADGVRKMFCFFLKKKIFCKYRLLYFNCTAYQSLQAIVTDPRKKELWEKFCTFSLVLPFCLFCYFWGLQCASELLKYLLSPFLIAATQHVHLQFCVLPRTVSSLYIPLNTNPIGFKVWTLNNPFLILLIREGNNTLGLQDFVTNAFVWIYFLECPVRTMEKV